MNYSYVMGIAPLINDLKPIGFIVEADGNNYMVSFPDDKTDVWENFISTNLKLGYWNEYLTDIGVVFLFHLEDGIKKYIVKNYENEEVLRLCEKLCNCKFETIKSMLRDNHFYKDKIND